MCCANYCVRRFCFYVNLHLCHSYMGAGAQAFEIAFVLWKIFGIDFTLFLVLIGLYMLLLIMIITGTFMDRTWTRKYSTRTAMVDLKGFWWWCYVVQNSQNFSGLFPSSCIPKKNATFRKLDVCPSSGEGGGKTSTQLGHLDRANPVIEISSL
jgi:hypothetical protein